jgi:hypothetical protein
LKGKKKKIGKLKRIVQELETLDNIVKSENEKFREHSTKIREKHVELKKKYKSLKQYVNTCYTRNIKTIQQNKNQKGKFHFVNFLFHIENFM